MIVKYRIKCPCCFQESIYDFDIEEEKPFTNADRIRSMTTRGMVETLSDLYAKISGKQLNIGEQRELLKWLIKEVDDGS